MVSSLKKFRTSAHGRVVCSRNFESKLGRIASFDSPLPDEIVELRHGAQDVAAVKRRMRTVQGRQRLALERIASCNALVTARRIARDTLAELWE